jgi:hypothetical protein
MHSIPVAKTKEEGLIKQEKKKEVLDAAPLFFDCGRCLFFSATPEGE